MTSELITRFRNDVAPRLLAKFSDGGVAAIARVLTSNADPLLPPTVAETSQEINVFTKGVTSEMLRSDPNLQVSDLAVLVAAVDYSPSVDDVIEVNGKKTRVIKLVSIPASGRPVIHWMYVR